MLTANNNRTESMIIKDGTALLAGGTVITTANLPLGVGAIVNLANEVLDDSTSGHTLGTDFNEFRIAVGQGTGKPFLLSNVMHVDRVTATFQKYIAPTQQISYIGYDGSAGTLPSASDTSYYIKVRKKDNDAANRSHPTDLFFQYKTDSSATQAEVAFGLHANAVKNLAKEAAGTNGYIKAEVVSNGTAAVISDGSQTQDAIVVNGSKYITLVDTGTSTAGDTSGIASAIPVGSIIYIAGATYRVDALSANVVTLHAPYQGASATVTGGTTVASQFGEYTTVPTSYGIKLTGVQPDFDVNAFRDYYEVRFSVFFSDASTTVTTPTAASEGAGAWQKVAMDEYMNWGAQGQNEMIGVPPVPRRSSVTSGEEYSNVTLSWTETKTGLAANHGAKGSVRLWLELDGSSELANANTGFDIAATLLNIVAGVTLTTQLDE